MRAALLCLGMLLCLLWVTMAHGDEPDDTITIPRVMAEAQLARYQEVVAERDKAIEIAQKAIATALICQATFSGMK